MLPSRQIATLVLAAAALISITLLVGGEYRSDRARAQQSLQIAIATTPDPPTGSAPLTVTFEARWFSKVTHGVILSSRAGSGISEIGQQG